MLLVVMDSINPQYEDPGENRGLRIREKQVHSSKTDRSWLLPATGAAALAIFVLMQIASGWRYFPGFLGDHGWYLQVALRASRGDALYSDVAWAYGPLPTQALAILFRWLGADAAWASLVNGILTSLSVLLTYAVLRSLVSSAAAVLLTAFAAIAGPYVWGDLFHSQFYVYTQAVAWGSVSSLAALAAALRWQRTRRDAWLVVAGVAVGLAILSKPEFGVTALGASVAVVAAARGSANAWARLLIACALVATIGFGSQTMTAGWQPVWRGYTGYDQLGEQSLWGASMGELPRLLGFYGLWVAAAAIWTARRWSRWRMLAYSIAGVAGLVSLAFLITDLAADSRGIVLANLRQGTWSQLHWAPANALLLLVAAPWAPLFWLLLAVGWLARRHQAPPAWWGLWAFALLANLRLVLTGFASGLAAAPALAVLWWLLANRWRNQPLVKRRAQRLALAALAALCVVNLAAQVLVPNPFFNGPRTWLDSELGRIQVVEKAGQEAAALQAAVEPQVAAGAPIFAAGWGAHWYLLTGHPNPTAFDVVMTGMGSTDPERTKLRRALTTTPPNAIFVPARRPTSDVMAALGLESWWQRAAHDYTDRTPAGVETWKVLLPG